MKIKSEIKSIQNRDGISVTRPCTIMYSYNVCL